MTDIKILKCREDAVIPKYAHDGDAGMDIYAAEDVIVKPGCSVLVPTGIKMAIPYGYEVQIRPRSGVSLKTPLRIPNAPGTIDCGYRDEVNVIIYNDSFFQDEGINEPLTIDMKGCIHGTYKIRKGDRIAQMVVAKVEYASFKETDNVKAIGEDRGGGFGSSGVN
jgi:dUTP pyrophosphatase